MVHVLLNDWNDSRTTHYSITFSSHSPSRTALFVHSYSGPSISGDFLGPRTIPLRWRSRPHRNHSLSPTHRRQFERQQGAWRAAVAASGRCFQKGYLVRIYRTWSQSLILFAPSIPLILNLIALPPSPTSSSPTQASSAAPMLSMAKLIMHRHVRIVSLRFLLSTWLT